LAKESKQAFVVALVASHGDQLRRFLRTRVRIASDVPDLVQEVYLRLLRIPDHESIRSPEAYLFTVARHVVQQHTLRQARNPMPVEFDEMLNSPSSAHEADPAMELVAQQSIAEFQKALNELSPKAQATFLMHRRDGMTLEQIGVRLGISRPMAKKYLAKVLLHLRQRLAAAE
jgi:RNA polymerase sigma factor (sigma-70 family)